MSVSGQCFPACPLAYIFIWKLVFRGLIFLRFCNDSNEIRYDWSSEAVNFYFSEKIEKIVKRLIFFHPDSVKHFHLGWSDFHLLVCWCERGEKKRASSEMRSKCFLRMLPSVPKRKKNEKCTAREKKFPNKKDGDVC